VLASSANARRGVCEIQGHVGVLDKIYTFRPERQSVHRTERLTYFNDAIIAIAATLTVLNLTTSPDLPGDRLGHQIASQEAVLLTTLLAFGWIAGTWILSHRSLRQLRGVDHYMTLLIIFRTLTIALIPFATALLARGVGRPDFWVGVEAVSLLIFAEVTLAASATAYAHARGLHERAASPSQRRAALTTWVVILAITAAACIVAPWMPWLALGLNIATRVSSLLPLASDAASPGDPAPAH
jgi:uncharacterized membrane protein